MTVARHRQPARFGLYLITFVWMTVTAATGALAAPFAALVMDAHSGQVLYSENADTRLHPASLTKMMTLYITFQAVEHGEISLDDEVRISRNAASEPPSKLGLREGQRIKLRYLIRAAAVKSANDAATALGEAIEGSEAAFARRMNRTAKALGMTRTTFKNCHGLTENGHMSTARDMTQLGRHLLYDYPEYYNLFSRMTADAGMKTVPNTNRRFLSAYRGADGIKTGYTRAAGFNLVASAERGSQRIIATVFGERSTPARNAKVAELLDMGFRKAPARVALNKPSKPSYAASAAPDGAAGKTIRLVTAVPTSVRPRSRPGMSTGTALVVASKQEILEAVEEAQAVSVAAAIPEAAKPAPAAAAPAPTPVLTASAADIPDIAPRVRPQDLVMAGASSVVPSVPQTEEQQVVERVSTSGGRHWGINIGRYPSRYAAEKVLLKTALAEMSALDGSLRKVVDRVNGYDANFMGLSRESADLACRRLQARNVSCFMIGPS
ncbi:serine hydrolase [Aquicoccus sp. SCR17]|nr:serine hydrolase [Carideicomes alvinocaridis]